MEFLVFISYFYTILKVTFHLQLLQNIGYIPHFVQYILEPILHPTVCTSHSPTPILPLPSPHLQPLVCSLWAYFFFVIFNSLLYFLDSMYKWYHTVFVFLWLFSLSIMPSKPVHVAANCKISCIYIPHLLNPFICWCTFKLLSYLGNCR